jgi:ABC-type sugar transport system ATPase subunit
MKTPALLKIDNISKSFGGVQALDSVSIDVAKGEVHAIVGENGAGKSTLMKIIAGALQPDSGRLEFEGSEVSFEGPRDASQMGISIVYQEPIYFKELSVVENIYLGEEIKQKRGTLDWNAMTTGSAEAVETMGLPAEILHKSMSELTLGTQQLVLIARSIHKKAKILILDEPTAILSQAETDILFKTIRELKKQGVSILYISHRLEEIFQIADRISVLRDGKKVADYDIGEADENKLVLSMTGRSFSFDLKKEEKENQKTPLLEVQNLSRAGVYHDLSFEVKPGEILGLYGLVGAGRSESMQAIYGELPPDAGAIKYKGKEIRVHNSLEAINQGIVYVPEDRRHYGLFLIRAIHDNLSASVLRRISNKLGVIQKDQEMQQVDDQVNNLKIKAGSIFHPVSSLSGGNQQKVVLGRGLSLNPELLILDEPTHGIDVGTKNEIHKLIIDLAKKDIAIILISSELPEVLALADNILVMHEGSKMGYLSRDEADEESILRLALGLNNSKQKAAVK